MRYRLHDDIILTKVCDIFLLVALRNSWEKFEGIRQLSPIQGCFCQGIEKGMNEDEIIEAMQVPKKLKKEKLRELYQSFIRKMLKDGYLVQEEIQDES